MAYRPFPIQNFQGLRLTQPPELVTARQAKSCNNVELASTGGLRSRPGLEKVNASSLVSLPVGLYAWSPTRTDSNSPRLVYSNTGDKKLRSIHPTTGAVTATDGTASTSGVFHTSAVNYGTPSATYLYVADITNPRRFDGSAFTAATQASMHVAVSPLDNRLVCANITGQDSRVKFSDPGDPTTFGANNFVDLTPGDGEWISAMVTWRELLFVFKQSKFFVFYGQSVDGSGNPIFNYRSVSGVGAVGNTMGSACVGPDAVYFLASDGVYATTGGVPTSLSSNVKPLFSDLRVLDGSGTSAASAGLLNKVVFARGMLMAHGVAQYVYYPQIGEWVAWSGLTSTLADQPVIAAAADTSTPNATENQTFYSLHSTKGLLRMRAALTDDDGAAISSFYRSGLWTTGNQPSQDITIRETILEGVGSPTFSLARDGHPAQTTGGGAKQVVELGSGSNIGQGRHRIAQKGRRFCWQIEGTSPWQLNSATCHVRDVRPPGLEGDSGQG